MQGFKQLIVRSVLALLALGASWAQAQDVKAVYHVNTGVETIAAILGNVRNHLNAEPSTKIAVVTHGAGIDFLLDGAKDSKGREFSGMVSDLASKGVQFRVCNNTLTSRKIAYGVVMSASVLLPPITRLEIGQETNAGLGSTRVTSMP